MPSIFDYERRPRKGSKLRERVGLAALLILALGFMFIVLAEVLSWAKVVEGNYTPWDDQEICAHLDQYANGDDPKIINYCNQLGL